MLAGTTPTLALHEGRQIQWGDTNGVQDAHVRELALCHQAVHRRRAHAELRGHVAYRQESVAFAVHDA